MQLNDYLTALILAISIWLNLYLMRYIYKLLTAIFVQRAHHEDTRPD